MVTRAKPASERAFARLSEFLLDGADIHRCAAATALGKIAYPGAGTKLIQALLDEDEDVRVDAVAALLVLKDPQTADAVMENLLGDPCPEVKLSAIEMLANVDHEPVVPWLHKMVAGRDEEINWESTEYYNSGWDDWLDIQLAAIKALGKIGTADSVPVIVSALENEEGQDVSQFAIPALAQSGNEGADALAAIYASGDAQTRRRVCSVLVPGQSAQMDELLDACLADKAGEVRLVAVQKMIKNNTEDARLPAYFEDENPDVRKLVAKTVGANEPEKAIAGLSDKSPEVRQTIFRTIAANPDAFEKHEFSEVVKSAIVGVPEVAADAAVAWAAMIGKPSAKSLGQALLNLEQPREFRLGLIEALSMLDEAGLPYLIDVVADRNRQVRISTLSALANIATVTKWPNKAGDTLLAALRGKLVEPDEEEENPTEENIDEDIDTTPDEEQPEAIADEKLPEATSTLDQILRDEIRAEAVPEEGLEPTEIELSQDDEKFIEISKQRALRKRKISLDAKVAPHLDVRQFAARLLGDFDFPGLTQALVQALESDDAELKHSCLESLALIGAARGRLKKRLYPAISAATQTQDSLTRMLACRCLTYIKGKQAKEALIELCGDHDVHVRREAITALGRKKGHISILLRALDDEYSGVRSAAAQALCYWREEMDALIDLTLAYDGMHRHEIITMLKDWNANEAAEKYLKILEDDARKRTWLVAITALSELFSCWSDEDIQAVA